MVTIDSVQTQTGLSAFMWLNIHESGTMWTTATRIILIIITTTATATAKHLATSNFIFIYFNPTCVSIK